MTTQTITEWISRPTCSGWWLWRECGDDSCEEKILVAANGLVVAYDAQYEEVTGRKPSEVMGENYWEGTDTTQEFMPGTWKLIEAIELKPY